MLNSSMIEIKLINVEYLITIVSVLFSWVVYFINTIHCVICLMPRENNFRSTAREREVFDCP